MLREDETWVREIKLIGQILLLPIFMLGYIGAQTGSLIIQAVIAASVGIAVAVRLYWSRIKKLFTRGGKSGETPADAVTAEEGEVEASLLSDEDDLESSLLPEAEMSEPEKVPEATGPDAAGGETGVEE